MLGAALAALALLPPLCAFAGSETEPKPAASDAAVAEEEADSAAQEVTPGTLSERFAPPTLAREVPVGEGAGAVYEGSVNSWREPDRARIDGETIILDPTPDPNQDTLSELYERLFLRDYYGISANPEGYSAYDHLGGPAAPYGYRESASDFEPRRWKISGELGFAGGSSTYGNNDGQTFALREKLDKGGRTYEFYQEHNIDRSYVNSAETVLGAKQRFERWLWEGDLRLTEEFTEYKDKNDGLNNRQEGRFDLDFRPKFNGGQTEAVIEYGYRIKEYETFSPRSYKHNSGKLRLTQHFSDALTGSAQLRYDSYDYSLGSSLGNRKTELSTEWEYKASDDLRLSASVESEQKSYSARKTRDYEQLTTRLSAVWQPDADSLANVSLSRVDRVGTFAPSQSYNEDSATASYQRQLTDELSLNLSATEREKSFDLDSDRDLSQHSQSLSLSYNPDEAWRFGLNLGRDDHAYALPVRAYVTTRSGLSAGYYCDGVSYSVDYSHSENDYDSDALRDFSNDSWTFAAGWRWDRSSLDLSYSYGLLDQADPASFNDYTDNSFSGAWKYEINPDTDFHLSYTSSDRSYDAQPSVTDKRLEAKLEFDL